MSLRADAETVDPSLKLILGVDRLDYTKGIIHRVRGFERLLDTYPEHLESVVLLQVRALIIKFKQTGTCV